MDSLTCSRKGFCQLRWTIGLLNSIIGKNFSICDYFKCLQIHQSSNTPFFNLLTYLVRYVRFIEGEIHDALSLHQRGEDGLYSRRVSSVKHVVKDVFVPPHLYGQLTQHAQGFKMLHQDTRVVSLLRVRICFY